MKIAFDLDGTLYDTFSKIFEVDMSIIRDLGYQESTEEEYLSKFQSKDWNKFYRDLGVKDEDLEKVTNEFYRRFKLSNPPELIPVAIEIIRKAEDILGSKNIYLITNESQDGVRKRFERDGLTYYFDRVYYSAQGKSRELYLLATTHNPDVLFYVGDLVSDGEDCREARNLGATNLRFCGMVHPYSMNPKESMNGFVEKNRDFAQVLNGLNEVSKLWALDPIKDYK
jgi:FMN phosphatase YigB (HAD superfamily)